MAKTRTTLLGTTMFAGLAVAAFAGLATPALAQSTQVDDVNVLGQTTEVEEIVVTGSRIRRDPTNSPTPLQQVAREQLLTTGQSTVIDYLATIPALSSSQVPSDTTGTGLNDSGLSLGNLRALGTVRTLTLVDGRRHVGSGGGSLSVDVDTIPRLLIENVEIITGGASSVYGADAVSGVLNFVLRRSFEGLEIDANYGMINQNGEANRRISALAGANLLDDRLNLYVHGEYEELDELRALDVDWIRDSYNLTGIDVDPTNPAIGPGSDGIIDARVYSDVLTMQRLRWGVVNLANNQPGSPLNDPDVTYNNCQSVGTPASVAVQRNVNCTLLNPGYTYVFDGTSARLADFGTRIGTGLQRVLNIGGDGELASEYAQFTFFPESESKRFQAGANFDVTSNIRARFEAKYVSEETFDEGQPTFFDIFINNATAANSVQPILATSQYQIRLSDNAYIPSNLRTAIENNQINIYSAPTNTAPSVLLGTAPAPYARSALRGPDRSQLNTRELTRYVASLEGELDQLLFVDNLRWDVGYTYGEVDIANRERGVDVERMAFASDAVIDSAGIVNGQPGQIVCRVQLLNAQNVALLSDAVRGGDLRATPEGQAAISACEPLNIFGRDNQSPEALEYIFAEVGVTQRNEQEQAIASVAGELWDFFGAGPIGVALGVEYRREFTEGTGRDRETGDRFLFLNTSPDFPGAEYESEEAFAELSLPLLRDSWLGEYAELSGSYRYFDYTTTGTGDVYGVNFIYRPIQDITFKSSYNTSFRAPNLGENFSPQSQTFANFSATDPCTTANINLAANIQFRENRIANCTALAQAQGLSFDFAGATGTNTDDFNPAYGTGGTAGVNGGNPFLQPETSESFTFSTVLQPRFIPNFSLVLDYYEIEIADVIATVTAQTAVDNCVNGPSLNTAACATIFRNNPTIPFGIGAPTGDPIGGFIQGSINYAKRTSRGLDFIANYGLDTEEIFGRNFGRFDYRLNGSWLLESKQFNNASNPNDVTQLDSNNFIATSPASAFPRVRFTSSLTYSPSDVWSLNWTVDWQSATDNASEIRDYVLGSNGDARVLQDFDTGNFARHDFTVRYNVRDDLALRVGVVNAFDAEQARYFGSTLVSAYDPWGTRFFIGLNWRPY